MKTLTKSMVTFTITPEQEWESIERALSFEQTGADHSEYINKVIGNDGYNVWLWCSVKVTAEFNRLTGISYLGQCAYNNEADFIAGGYYEQMQDEAFADLKPQIDAITEALKTPSIIERARTWFKSLSLQTLAVNAILWVYPLAVIVARAYVTLQNR